MALRLKLITQKLHHDLIQKTCPVSLVVAIIVELCASFNIRLAQLLNKFYCIIEASNGESTDVKLSELSQLPLSLPRQEVHKLEADICRSHQIHISAASTKALARPLKRKITTLTDISNVSNRPVLRLCLVPPPAKNWRRRNANINANVECDYVYSD